MHKVIISDTSCLIVLEKIGELSLLKNLYKTVLTTIEVSEEFGNPLPEWVEVKQVKDKNCGRVLSTIVDKGEASAIALALETQHSILIIDDFKGRKLAEQLGLPITGTLGVILKAKESKIILSIRPIIKKLKTTNFRISQELEKELLKLAKE